MNQVEAAFRQLPPLLPRSQRRLPPESLVPSSSRSLASQRVHYRAHLLYMERRGCPAVAASECRRLSHDPCARTIGVSYNERERARLENDRVFKKPNENDASHGF